MPTTPKIDFKNILEQLESSVQDFQNTAKDITGEDNWVKYAHIESGHNILSDFVEKFHSSILYKAIEDKNLFVYSATLAHLPFKKSKEKPDKLFKQFKEELLKSSNLKELAHDYRVDKEFEDDSSCRHLSESVDGGYLLGDDNSMLFIELFPSKNNKKVIYRIVTTDKKIFDDTKKISEKYLDSESAAKNIFAVIDSDRGLKLESIGNIAKPLDRDNYSESVLKDFDYVADQFSKDDPFGRIVIMHGKTGTGKTHIIQGLIDQLNFKKVKFIFLPSDFLMSFNVASFTKLLIRESDGSSLVLIIEDGDDCLLPRKSDNMSAINKLLNISDGPPAKMLDIRTIITTNAPHQEIEEAIVRPGRLCKKIDVGLLSSKQATEIVKKHTGEDVEFKEDKTLAEVYGKIHEIKYDIEIIPEEKKVMGFKK